MDLTGATPPPSHGNDRDSPRQSEDATVREWTDLLARVRFGVVRFGKRKSVAAGSIKAVAARVADYADADGSRVYPGLARLTVDTELSYETVKMAVAVLVRYGLLRLVRAGTQRGYSDRYQLQIPCDLLDRDDVEVWSPARHCLEIERIRTETRGRRKPVGGDPDDHADTHVQGAQPPARHTEAGTRAGCSTTCTPVDNSDVQGAQPPAHTAAEPERAGCSAPADSNVQGAEGGACRVLSTPPPTKDLDTTTTHHEMADVRTAVTVLRATGPSQDQISSDGGDEPLPVDDSPAASEAPVAAPADAAGRCTAHPGMRGGHNPDGSLRCTFCRAAARLAAEVTPLRPVPAQASPAHDSGSGAVVVPFRPRTRSA